MHASLPSRIESKIAYEPNTGCWLWTGALGHLDYGWAWYDGKGHGAHRLVYTLLCGAPPDGMVLRHICDVATCVNPAHLLLGTQADNIADRDRRARTARGTRHGRHTHPETSARGEGHGMARLTEAQVREMRRLRADGLTLPALAARFGVTAKTVSKVVNRQAWEHIA